MRGSSSLRGAGPPWGASTPAATRSLPAVALVDLRRVLFHVGLALGSQARGRAVGREVDDARGTTDLPARPGDLPSLHPALGIACEGRCGSSRPACVLRGATAHGQQELCHPPHNRRRARGTLRAMRGTANWRTRGRAETRPAERRVRDAGRARGSDGEGGDEEWPRRAEGDDRAPGGSGERSCEWDPVMGALHWPLYRARY